MFIIPNSSFASIANITPKVKSSLKQKVCAFGSGFKKFFKDHAKIYRM
jgi:hypothetical protein